MKLLSFLLYFYLLTIILSKKHHITSILQQDMIDPTTNPCRIELIAQKHNGFYSYYGVIIVGKNQNGSASQPFKILFDTGSCDFWIPDTTCHSEACEFKFKYEHNTVSLSNYEMAEFSIPFKDGEIEGVLARETIFLTPNFMITDQTIGLVTKANFPLLFKSEFDGIMGLSYPTKISREQNILPVFDNIISKGLLKSNIFSIYINDNYGNIIFGSWDDSFKENKSDNFVWIPLAEQNYWTFFIIDIYLVTKDHGKYEQLKNNEKLCPKGCQGVIDTGTYFMYGPGSLINNIIEKISSKDCDDLNNLPDLIIQMAAFSDYNLKKRITEIRLTPSDYLIQLEDECVLGLKANNEEIGFTFGWLFLKAFYTVFDRDKNRLGFAKSNKNPS